jgi:hypothetical protein
MGTETVRMVVEPDDYYNLIEGNIEKGQCLGNYFYQPNDNLLLLSTNSNVKEVNVFPLLVK